MEHGIVSFRITHVGLHKPILPAVGSLITYATLTPDDVRSYPSLLDLLASSIYALVHLSLA